MDSSSEELGVGHDQSKCSNLNMEEKKKLVYQITNQTDGSPEILQSWSRQEILEILCAEMGKERKFTGLTKLKMIENLLKVVSEKQFDKFMELEESTDLEPQSSLRSGQKASKRQRKCDYPSRLPVLMNNLPINKDISDLNNTVCCKNSACRATVSRNIAFCRRCSCCICYQYDDNKDPSLWLTCSSEPLFQGDSCGMSCHLECALGHERSGILIDEQHRRLDGSFYCVACGKGNDLLGCLRKQLMVAKDTRRVDILCYRVSLSQKVLKGTEKYLNLHEIVNETAKKLEVEVGPFTGLSVKMGRGIVNRLSCGAEVQKLCVSAVELLDSMLSNVVSSPLPSPVKQGSISVTLVRFEDVCSTSLTVNLGSDNLHSPESNISFSLWHRKANDTHYPGKPTCILFVPDTKFVVSDLTPSTEYHFKVLSFNGHTELGMFEACCSTSSCEDQVLIERSQSPVTNCSTFSIPSSMEDESNNVTPDRHEDDKLVDGYLYSDTDNKASANCALIPAEDLLNKEYTPRIPGCKPNSDAAKNDGQWSSGGQRIETSMDDGSDHPIPIGMPNVDNPEASFPITPCKLANCKEQRRSRRSKSSNKGPENGTNKMENPQDGGTSKKRGAVRQDDECLTGKDFEHYVKLIRCLECEGHVEKNFRQKFLTWYSLRATPRELRILKVFVDTFQEDPASLAGQLVDTFAERISTKRSPVVPMGFCMRLWH